MRLPVTSLAAAIFTAVGRAALAQSAATYPVDPQSGLPLAPVVAPAPTSPLGQMKASVLIGGREVRYRGEAGEMVMTDAAGRPRATIFSVAYLAEGQKAESRPVTFVFNGGPGGASNSLRQDMGPKRIAPGPTRGAWAYVDNPQSILDATDLVFIDAPGTGFGRFYSEDAKREYWGVEQDAAAFEQFVEKWLASHGRLSSPRYILGESYGGVRSGFLAEALAKKGLKADGIILISPSTTVGGANPLGEREPAVLALPTQAAVARFHGKGAYGDLSIEEIADKAKAFALGPYAAALAKGAQLGEDERTAIARQVSDLTGISADSIKANGMKVTAFGDSLLPGERLGRDDGRLHAPIEVMKKLPRPYDEPGSTLYTLPYDLNKATAAYYVDLFGYSSPTPYVRFSDEVSKAWKNNPLPRGPTSVPLMFKQQMAADPKLRMIIFAGYFDTTIPYLRSLLDYQAAALPHERYDFTLLKAGHPVFFDPIASQKVGARLRAFYRNVRPTLSGVTSKPGAAQ